MNKQRRKAIEKILSEVTEIGPKFADLLNRLNEIGSDLSGIRDDEQNSLDAMSDKKRGSDAGIEAQQAVDYLNTAMEFFDSISSIEFDLPQTLDALDGAGYSEHI